jgi:hypothetical protein
VTCTEKNENKRSRDHMYINNYNIFGCGYKIRAAPDIKVEDMEGSRSTGGASCFICTSSVGRKDGEISWRKKCLLFCREGPKDDG